MTNEEYRQLLERGKTIFAAIAPALNKVSKERIRTMPTQFRREEDFKEICAALALLEIQNQKPNTTGER